jgi:hypothetical protein
MMWLWIRLLDSPCLREGWRGGQAGRQENAREAVSAEQATARL